MAPDYANDAEWADVVPIPQNEGGPKPLAAIDYSDEYRTATSYLRAVMAANELDHPRAFELTEHIIGLNPAHYTVWLYRAAALRAQDVPPERELAWLDGITPANLKGYQIWHHREVVADRLTALPAGEMAFLARMLAKDAKNYHVWSYRQWLVRRFALWPDTSAAAAPAGAAEGGDGSGAATTGEGGDATPEHRAGEQELRFTEALLVSDVRNNSAWNHRFYVLFGRTAAVDSQPPPAPPAPWVFERERDFAQRKIALAPQNAAAWNYLRGVARAQTWPATGNRTGEYKVEPAALTGLEGFARRFADIEGPVEEIRSSHALELLAEIWGAEGEAGAARRALQILAERLEPVRKGYWEFRMRQLPLTETVAA